MPLVFGEVIDRGEDLMWDQTNSKTTSLQLIQIYHESERLIRITK